MIEIAEQVARIDRSLQAVGSRTINRPAIHKGPLAMLCAAGALGFGLGVICSRTTRQRL